MDTPRVRLVGAALAAATLLFIGFLFFHRLSVNPAPWHDEGTYLHVAKNLVRTGVYADYSSEGNRYTGPVVSAGPTLILPIAAVFAVTGIKLLAARLVMTAYGLLLLGGFCLLGRLLGGNRFAFAALLLVLVCPQLNLPYYARTVLGEAPSLAYLLLGLWLWMRDGARRPLALVGVGLLFGCAAITKNQTALVILPGLLVALGLDRLWYRRRGWLHFIIPGLVGGLAFAGWSFYVLYRLGGGERDVAADLEALRLAGQSGFFITDWSLVRENREYLMHGDAYVYLLLPGLLYGWARASRRTADGERWGILSVLFMLASTLFLFSVGWPRFAVTALVLGAFPVAGLLHDLTGGFRLPRKAGGSWGTGRSLSPTWVGTLLLVGLFWPLVASPALGRITVARIGGNPSVYRLVEAMNAQVPPSALIETWEAELQVLSEHRYHYAPQVVEAYVIRALFLGGPPAAQLYDFRELDPDYVVVGPSGKWASLYPEDRLAGFELMTSSGQYDLYRRRTQP